MEFLITVSANLELPSHNIRSSYEVQFLVLQDDMDDLTVMTPKTPPASKPDDTLASLEEAQASSHPVSFVVHYDNSSQLPEELVIAKDLLHKALKDGTTYRMVFVAITDAIDVSSHPSVSVV